jgi:hypothetical protein
MKRILSLVLLLVVAAPLHAQTKGTAPEFDNISIRVPAADGTRDVRGFIRFESAHLIIGPMRPPKGSDPDPSKTWNYTDIVSGEYSYSKAPHYAAAIVVSPLFLFTRGKAHWLTIKTKDDYAILHLDKSNYQIVIAELENRSHIKVGTVADMK